VTDPNTGNPSSGAARRRAPVGGGDHASGRAIEGSGRALPGEGPESSGNARRPVRSAELRGGPARQ